MALLPLHSSYFPNKPHLLLSKSLPHRPTKPKFTILSQNPSSQPSKPTTTNDPNEEKKPTPSSGQGFGPAQQPKPSETESSKKKGRRDRGTVIRRTPVEKPAFLDKKVGEVSQEQSANENAFLVTWLGLGVLILVEGLALAASGFLPEEWDKFFVKFLYPSFTPTVFLFIAGTVVYGVFKYFQNENARNE